MVDWICEACETYGISRTTAHVACEQMDRFCSSDTVPTHRLALVSLAAIQIAAKYEEQEEDVPPVQVLIERSGHPIPERQLNQMEVLMLTASDWSCTTITPMHFVTHLAARGLVFRDDKCLSGGEAPPHVGRFMDFFADLCCQDHGFSSFRPSAVAGGIALASRRALRFERTWHPRLAEVLSAPIRDVAACFFRLWQIYSEQFGEEVDAIDADYGALGTGDSVHWLRQAASGRVARQVQGGPASARPAPFAAARPPAAPVHATLSASGAGSFSAPAPSVRTSSRVAGKPAVAAALTTPAARPFVDVSSSAQATARRHRA